MTPDRPTDLREVQLRAQVEREVEADTRDREERELDRDAALQAVTFSVFLMVCIGLPVLAAALGAAVRIFGWASGLY